MASPGVATSWAVPTIHMPQRFPGYDFQSHYLTVGNHRLHYLDEGAGEPLVMLHGNPTWSFLYRRFVGALRDRYRVIVPDHMGCGLSDRPPEAEYRYTLASRVADLEALLASLHLQKNLTLFLHDWGGLIGMAFAARHPESIRRLVIFNTAGFLLPASKRMHWSIRFCRSSRLAAFLVLRFNVFTRIAVRLGCHSRPMPNDVRRAYIQACDDPGGRLTTLRFVQDIPFSEKDPAYPVAYGADRGLACFRSTPAVIFWGERDFVFDRDFLREWRARLPRAEVHTFARAGHYVLEESFDAILPLVTEFLARPTAYDH